MQSFYRSAYNRIVYQIKNKIKITNKNKQFLEEVMQKKNLFEKKKSIKETIKSFDKLQSDQNIVTRFIYRHLGDNIKKLPSDVIINIIQKAFTNFASYYALKEKGLKANKCAYLGQDEMFIIPFFIRSFVVNKETRNVRLTVGAHIAQNYKEVTKRTDIVMLNEDNDAVHKNI